MLPTRAQTAAGPAHRPRGRRRAARPIAARISGRGRRPHPESPRLPPADAHHVPRCSRCSRSSRSCSQSLETGRAGAYDRPLRHLRAAVTARATPTPTANDVIPGRIRTGGPRAGARRDPRLALALPELSACHDWSRMRVRRRRASEAGRLLRRETGSEEFSVGLGLPPLGRGWLGSEKTNVSPGESETLRGCRRSPVLMARKTSAGWYKIRPHVRVRPDAAGG